MKLTIENFEIEIKAKKKGQKRSSQKETLNFLCNLEGMYYSLSNSTFKDYPGLSKQYERIGLNIHDELDKHGYYDEYKDDSVEKFN